MIEPLDPPSRKKLSLQNIAVVIYKDVSFFLMFKLITHSLLLYKFGNIL